MKTTKFLSVVLGILAGLPLLARAQSPVLLNINDATYPTVCSVANYQALGIPGLNGSTTISQFSPAFNVGLASPMNFTNGGQAIYLSSTSSGGTYFKPTGAGATNGLMDSYLFITTATPITLTVSNLNLTPGTNYTLYLIGTVPVSGSTEDGLFQPVNSANITFNSTATGHGILAVSFSTSASLASTDTLKFTWAKYSGNGSFQGLAIVPGGTPSQTQSLTFSNGVQKYSFLTNTTVTMTGKCEVWATNALVPLFGCVVNLNSTDAWLFLPNVKPSIAAQSPYLGQVKINGNAAVVDNNCRVVQYGQNGCIVIPHVSTFQPLTVYSQPQFGGTATAYSQWTYYTGSGIANISSFRLKRGYQAVLAQSANGINYSKCYVAQDGDLEIGVLPATLDKQVQFIYVTPWRWVPKKSISGDPGLPKLNLGSWYDWNIDSSSTRDLEYVAIRQTQYWPGLGQNWQSLGVNTVLGYNEPDQANQANLSVATAISSWGDLLGTGLRVGSPAPSDGGPSSWLFPFVNQADAAGLRVDFVAQHYYQSHNPADAAGAATQMYNFLLNIWNNTHRPIWVTEWNNGANWTDGTWPAPTYAQQQACVSAMLNMLETTPFVERYQLYNWVEDPRSVTTNGIITAAGITYRDKVSALSYSQAMPDNGTRGLAQFLFATNAFDNSGYYNNGLAVGAPAYTVGHNSQAQAVVLDGANNYLQLPANIAKGSAFTFSGWIYWNGGTAWQRIFDFGNDTTHYFFLTPNTSGSTLRFAINNGSGEQIVERAGVLASGSWQHVAVTLNGNTAIIYVNGVSVATSTSFSIAPSAFSPMKNYLGKSQFATDPLFSGKLDDVEIADYAMTAAQISAIYNSTLPPASAGGVWNNNANGNWGISNNWNSGMIATGVGYLADFSTINITSDRTVTLDSARTNGGLRFGDTAGAQNWILSGGNTLTLDAGGTGVPAIAVNQNTATIATPLVGNNGFAKSGSGTLILNSANAVGGGLTVSGGAVSQTGGSTSFGSGTSSVGYLTGSGTLSMTSGNLTMGGELRVGGSDQSGSQYAATGAVTVVNSTLSVGTLTVGRGNSFDNSISGTVLLNAGSTLISTNDVMVGFAGTGRGRLALNGGNLIVGPAATKWLMVGVYDSANSELNITNGNILLENNTALKMCRGGNTGSNVVNHIGGSVTFYSDAGVTIGGSGNLDMSYAGGINSTSVYNLRGGTLTVPQVVATASTGKSTFNFNGGTLKPAGSTTTFMQGLTAARVLAFGAKIDTTNFNVTIAQALLNISGTDGGLTKNGSGTLTLAGTNTYNGNTAINAGTLVLGGAGSISNSANIAVGNGALFDVSAVAGGFTVAAARTLSGSGSVNGVINNAGAIAPGTPAALGSLTFNNPPVLNPAAVTRIKIDRNGGSFTNDQVILPSSALTYGGTLNVINLGAALQAGDTFQLFSATGYNGAFAATNLPSLDPGLGWSLISSSGVLSVVQTVATNPTNISFTIDVSGFTLSWPLDHLGWRLQAQTNTLATGMDTNWFDVAGSTATNSVTLPVFMDSGSVFYRLIFP